jgi:hypothetical protein
MGTDTVDLPWHGSALLMSEEHAFDGKSLKASTSVWLSA